MRRRRPEEAIRIGIRNFLRNVGFAVWDLEQNRQTRQTAGFPDLVAIGKGRTLFVEVKTPKGRLSPAQELFQDVAQENGAAYLVWRSSDDARAFLVEEGLVKEMKR